MHFGQYCSQYEARRLASGGAPQSRTSSQLLLGANDLRAVKAMKLRAQPWRSGPTARVTAWIRRNIAAGNPVIIGVYMNQLLFRGDPHPQSGDPEYDHIVTVHGTGPGDDGDATTRMLFSDHGLHDRNGTRPFDYNISLDVFLNTRAQANTAESGPYSLPMDTRNYGIAILGPADRDGVTLPVRLTSPARGENPPMTDGGDAPPPATPLDLTVRVFIADPSKAVCLYLYDDFSEIPDRKFNARAERAVKRWVFAPNSGREKTIRVRIFSNQVAAFRAVPADAP